MNLQIRNMKSDDFTDLYRLLSDSDVMRFLEPPFSKEQTSSFLKSAGLSESPLIYAVEAGETFIGYVIFHDYDDRSIEIGWVLFPDYWGKGYATQLTAQMIEKAKELDKDLIIECVPEQIATKHIAISHGFSYDGKRDSLDIYRYKH